jgi:putative membrane protein
LFSVRLLLNWLLSVLALLIVAHIVPGFYLSGVGAALIAAIAVGFVNATLGFLLHVITFPLTIFTLGIFWFVINALVLKLASAVVPGFHIQGFAPAFWGAIVLAVINTIFRWLRPQRRREEWRDRDQG